MTNVLHRVADAVRSDFAGRTVFGLAVPYNTPARVDESFGGGYVEKFAPGAFSRSIAERGSKVRLFAQHETRKFPIGKATELREATDGLHAAFAVARTREGDEALELVQSGMVDAFSVGFRPIRDRTDRDGVVVRVEAALHEVSLVAMPAYAEALVAGVRSARPSLSVDIARRRLNLILETW